MQEHVLDQSVFIRSMATQRLWSEVESIVAVRLQQRVRHRLDDPLAAELRTLVTSRSLDPWAAAGRLLAEEHLAEEH